jgi:hypothetical protein
MKIWKKKKGDEDVLLLSIVVTPRLNNRTMRLQLPSNHPSTQDIFHLIKKKGGKPGER